MPADALMRWNPPPGWPPVPEGWSPPAGWQPDPSWPATPYGWPMWVPQASPETPAQRIDSHERSPDDRSNAAGRGVPSRRSRRKLVAAAGLAALLIAGGTVAALNFSSSGGQHGSSSGGQHEPSAGPVTVNGVLEVFAHEGCDLGASHYPDVREGLPVLLEDQGGVIVGTGSLSSGQPGTDGSGSCIFTFEFDGVSLNSSFYTVNVGTGHGQVGFSQSQISDGDSVSITLGTK
jgi:hypothetical protein